MYREGLNRAFPLVQATSRAKQAKLRDTKISYVNDTHT